MVYSSQRCTHDIEYVRNDHLSYIQCIAQLDIINVKLTV